MKLRLPVFVKITAPLILIIILSVGLSGYRIYTASTQRWYSEMDRRLERIAQLVANTLDVAQLQRIKAPTDIDSPSYTVIAQSLKQAATAGSLSWLGIYRPHRDAAGQIALYYWVDSDYTGVGYPFFYATPDHLAALEDLQVHHITYADEFGAYYGFVAPVIVDGQAIGLVEAVIELEASQLLEERTLSQVKPILIGGMIIAIAATVLLSIFVFYQPLQNLQHGAQKLVSGQLGYLIPVTSRDELGNLANTFNRMSVEIARLYKALQAYNRELEERVQARTAELRGERNRLNTILRNIMDGLVVTDCMGRIVLTNSVFEQTTTGADADLNGRTLADVLPLQALQDLIAQAQADTQRVFSVICTWKSPTFGYTERTYKVSAAALAKDVNGETERGATDNGTLGVVTVLHDITHEAEIDRMKTDFISMVSHELRTPLTSVLGFAKLIQRTFERDLAPLAIAQGKRQQRAVERIYDNLGIISSEAERLTRLINDVLDIAKIEAGKIEWHLQDTIPATVIQSAVNITQALANAKELPVILDLAQPLPRIHADQDRIIQVITNLLSNAIKFTDHGSITICAHPFTYPADGMSPMDIPAHIPELAPGLWLLVSVQDTGIGIAPENFLRVFEKFQQVGHTLTDRPKGTGLGLTISKEIIESHGGQIWVESALSRGSTFSFVLPALEEMMPGTIADSHVLTDEESSRAEESLKSERARRILIVDDDPHIREFLNQALTEAGYQVLQAKDGLQALHMAREMHPDVIAQDLVLPGLDGFDVIKALHETAETATIPVVVISVLENREKSYQLGADAYLTKPVDAQAILTTIGRLLARAAR